MVKDRCLQRNDQESRVEEQEEKETEGSLRQTKEGRCFTFGLSWNASHKSTRTYLGRFASGRYWKNADLLAEEGTTDLDVATRVWTSSTLRRITSISWIHVPYDGRDSTNPWK